MKRVLIIGATGSLAQYLIEALKPLENVQLTLFARSKSKLKKSLTEGCTITTRINHSNVKFFLFFF